jgi:hypothetical protein
LGRWTRGFANPKNKRTDCQEAGENFITREFSTIALVERVASILETHWKASSWHFAGVSGFQTNAWLLTQ